MRAVAYRMLGSRSEAEDAVQESWLPKVVWRVTITGGLIVRIDMIAAADRLGELDLVLLGG